MYSKSRTQYPRPQRNDPVELSVVVPLSNEHEVLELLYKKLKAVVTPLGISHELLFVNDGSGDSTRKALANISNHDPSVMVVSLARHSGKESALLAGLALAGGRAVITMDGDLQDPPEAIPEMLNAWRRGADVVRMQRRRPPARSSLGHYVRLCLDCVLGIIFGTGMPEDRIDFMLYHHDAVTTLSLVTQRRRYMTSLFAWAGFRETVIEYQRLPRPVGGLQCKLFQ